MNFQEKELSSDFLQRDQAANILHWQDFTSWRDVVWNLMDDVLTDRVKSAFLKDPPEYIVGDDLSWLDEIILDVLDEKVDSKELMADRLEDHYKAFRVFHGTRTENPGSYYEKGVTPLDPENMHQKARDVFLGGRYPELTNDHLEKAIAAVGHELRSRRVYFEANEKLLIGQCGHYMLYGSEYLACIAVNLPSSYYQRELKKIGKPVMFVCDVPIEMISGNVILELAGRCLQLVFEDLLYHDVGNDDLGLFGFCIHQKLSPQNIVGHYHPIVHCDPLDYGGA